MKSLTIFCSFILATASDLNAEEIKFYSFDQKYSINITKEFCFDPKHPVSIEIERMLAITKKHLAVFLKCSDKFSGVKGWISRYSKPVFGDDISNQVSVNNAILSSELLIKNAEHFDDLVANYSDNEYLETLNQKLREGLSINNWSVTERKTLSVDRSHIIHAFKVSVNGETKTDLLIQSVSVNAPSVLFINIRLGATDLNNDLITYYGDLLKTISQSIKILDE